MALLHGDIELFAKISAGRGREELTVVGFDGVEAVAVSDETVEDAVGFKVGQVRISGGVTLNELTEVNDGLPGTGFGVDLGDDVRRRGVAVGAASSGRNSVEGAVEKGDV